METETAFEERRTLARKLGEEAGTKMLFPLMLMMGIVMAIVLMPAIFEFIG
jgi:1,4-dihydroxy-2-naphthoate octaprenyltransferase